METEDQKEKRGCIFKILAYQLRRNNFEVSYSKLWDLVQQNKEAKELFSNKRELTATIQDLVEAHKVMVDEKDNIYMI